MSLHDARELGPGSEVVCQCSAVRLSFPHDMEPRQRIECCCVDCREKCLWAVSLGGPALPAGVTAPNGAWREARDRPLPVPTVGQRFQELLADQGGQVEILGR